jgi:hypothetical protein
VTPGQWAVVALLLGLGLIGIPSYAAGWWNGRRCLRLTLDPRMMRPVEHPWTRAEAPTIPFSVAGRFPPEPALLWSEQTAAGAHLVREVHDWVTEAERLIPARWR